MLVRVGQARQENGSIWNGSLKELETPNDLLPEKISLPHTSINQTGDCSPSSLLPGGARSRGLSQSCAHRRGGPAPQLQSSGLRQGRSRKAVGGLAPGRGESWDSWMVPEPWGAAQKPLSGRAWGGPPWITRWRKSQADGSEWPASQPQGREAAGPAAGA